MTRRYAPVVNFSDLSPFVKKEFNYIARQQPVSLIEGTLSEVCKYRRVADKLPSQKYLACQVLEGRHYFAIYLKHPKFKRTMHLISRNYDVVAFTIDCDHSFVCDIIITHDNVAIVQDVYMFDHKYLATFQQQRYPAISVLASALKIKGYEVKAQEYWGVSETLSKVTDEWEGIYFFPREHNYFRDSYKVLLWTQPIKEFFDYEVLEVSEEVKEPRFAKIAMVPQKLEKDGKTPVRDQPVELEIVTSDDEEEENLHPFIYITIFRRLYRRILVRVDNSSNYVYELGKVYRFRYDDEGFFKVLGMTRIPTPIMKYSHWLVARKYRDDILRWVDNG